MDGKVKAERRNNPRQGVNPLSGLTFSWVLGTFWQGYRRDLEVEDLYKPLKEHKSSILGSQISEAWEKEMEAYEKRKQLYESKNAASKTYDAKSKVKPPSLTKVLIKCFGFKLLMYGIILAVMEILLRLSQPMFLGLLIRYCNQRKVIHYVPVHSVLLPQTRNSSVPQVRENEDATRSLSPQTSLRSVPILITHHVS